VNLIVLTKEEFADLKHFVTTGKRASGCHATDAWIGTMLKKGVNEIEELLDRCDVHFETARYCSTVVSQSRLTAKAWKNGDALGLASELRNLVEALKA